MEDLPIAVTAEHLLLSTLSIVVSVLASLHVLLHKKDPRAAIGWVGLIWLSPFIGTIVYVLLGINRIERKARALRRDRPSRRRRDRGDGREDPLLEVLGPDNAHLARLARLGEAATHHRLVGGNRVVPLDGGDEAYRAMARAIDEAERSITLLTYIFRFDAAGTPVADALARARARGVEIRVLIDALGSVHEGKPIVDHLRRLGLEVALFIPTLRPGWMRYANLRNHRKVLVVDGRVGFTGGMNILDDYLTPEDGRPTDHRPCRDLHFELRGPIVTVLQQAFADDWGFSTGTHLDGPPWYAESPTDEGPTFARVVVDGPDLEADPLAAVLFGALAVARRRATILTPYFIPDPPLSAALASAALRGVEVDIILPRQSNHRVVQWASIPLLEPLLEAGCRVWLSPPPFDHSKLMIVDDAWTYLGSANWDPRSLVLNFELNVECYDPALVASLGRVIACRRDGAGRLTLDDLRSRSIGLKLRDNIAALFSPYL